MEFERAIYRVYERCLDGLQDENTTADANQNETNRNENISAKTCKIFECFALLLGLFFVIVLILFHTTYIGTAGCIPNLLIKNPASINDIGLRDDQLLGIKIDASLIYGNTKKNLRSDDSSEIIHKNGYSDEKYISLFSSFDNIPLSGSLVTTNFIQNIYNIRSRTQMPNQTTNETANTYRNTYDYDYLFSFNVGLLILPPQLKQSHNFSIINITMTGSECFGSPTVRSLIQFADVDIIVANYLKQTFKKSGYLLSSDGEFRSWSSSSLHPYETIMDWIGYKIGIVFKGLLSFFLLSTVTALLVRILIASGVVLLFPIFWGIQALGVASINLRIISLSYPWIGIPMEILRARNQSTTPFIIAQICRVVVYYLLYQACQTATQLWLYDSTVGGNDQEVLWLFAIMMLWEYYSMIYVRSSGSIQLFPRASLALYLIYHIYYYSFPTGFHLLASAVLFCFLLLLMMYCVRVFEIKAYHRGLVSVDQPRMYYTSLPWPSWRMDLAPEFTLFMPLTHRSISVYQDAVPALVNGGGGGNPSTSTATATSNNVPSNSTTGSNNSQTSTSNQPPNGSISNRSPTFYQLSSSSNINPMVLRNNPTQDVSTTASDPIPSTQSPLSHSSNQTSNISRNPPEALTALSLSHYQRYLSQAWSGFSKQLRTSSGADVQQQLLPTTSTNGMDSIHNNDFENKMHGVINNNEAENQVEEEENAPSNVEMPTILRRSIVNASNRIPYQRLSGQSTHESESS